LSSASYFFSLVALSDSTSITLTSYRNSLQGDSALVEIYKQMGVDSRFENNSLILTRILTSYPATLNLDLNNTPDIAQTIVVTCLGLGGCHLTGLHTLKIKETDRLKH
jgi:3-phosphoshikimate 1-carboxyvinyltransferase